MAAPKPPAAISFTDRDPDIGQALSPPFFSGPYQSLTEAAGTTGNAFDDTPWIETAAAMIADIRNAAASGGMVIGPHLLPLVTLIGGLATNDRPVRVLDFGGGLGDNYLQVRAALAPQAAGRLDYLIVETPANCVAGEQAFAGQADRPSFAADLAAATGEFDVVILCGVLMYIDGWQGLLASIAKRTRGHVYVARTPMTRAAPTFFVRQRLVPEVGPWAGRYIGVTGMGVLNYDEVRSVMEAAGFEARLFTPLFDYRPKLAALSPPHNDAVQAMALFTRR